MIIYVSIYVLRGIMMKKRGLVALLPIGVFLALFLGIGIVTKDFYKMPAIVAFLVGLMVAMMQNKELSFDGKIRVLAKSVGDENVITMCLIFLAAGAFSGAVSASGGAESVVNFGLSIIPGNLAVVGLFVIGCFISLSMGTSMGTIATLSPIAIGISQNTGFSLAICMGSVVCGAMFGDNLSMISDTTIAAVKTQGCEMKDKFKENFFIVLPAAIISIVIFFFLTKDLHYVSHSELTYSLVKIIPYIFVLIGALMGINVFTVLIGGTVLSLIIGVVSGTIPFLNVFNVVGDGIVGMYDITVISIVVSCVVGLVRENGGIHFILDLISSRIKSSKGAEYGIALLVFLVDCCTANNTLAIIMSGPIAKEISDEFDVSNTRTASLLDIFASVGQGVIPYGAQLLSAASLSGLSVMAIMPYLYYPIFMALSALVFIGLRKSK